MKDPDEGLSRGGIGGESFVECFRGRHVGFGDDEPLLVGAAGQRPDEAADGEQDEDFPLIMDFA